MKEKGGAQMQSMDEIYQKYAQTVYRYLLSRTGNPEVAEELTQETFYQAMKSIDRYDGSCKILTWLCGIAKNQLHTYHRKNPIHESLDMEEEIEKKQQSPFVDGRSTEKEVLGKLEQIELMQRLHQCPEPFREIFYLRVLGGLSFKEIGEIIGKTENWTRVTYYRGKERLRKELKEYGK